jgi:hypothetical protein
MFFRNIKLKQIAKDKTIGKPMYAYKLEKIVVLLIFSDLKSVATP